MGCGTSKTKSTSAESVPPEHPSSAVIPPTQTNHPAGSNKIASVDDNSAHVPEKSLINNNSGAPSTTKHAVSNVHPVPPHPAKTGTMVSQGTARTLEPTTAALTSRLPRFRILVIGKSGAGKTTLINQTFGVDDAGKRSSNFKAGISEIDEELTSSSNDRFVLHDSMGFEPGEVDNFAKVTAFINKRHNETELKDRLHAIWLCVATPSTGGRSFETGDEDFLKSDHGGVPVIVVFTKYDILVSEVERSMDTGDDDLIEKEAKRRFDEACESRLKEATKKLNPPQTYVKVSIRYPMMLKHLVETTQKEIIQKFSLPDRASLREGPSRSSTPIPGSTKAADQVPLVEAVRLTWAMAQRVSPNLKIQASIEIGKQKYWRWIGTVPDFSVENHIDAIHADIINVWNFNDPQKLLVGDEFKRQILEEIKDLDDPQRRGTSVPQQLMGYIVDLTIIMENLSRAMHRNTGTGLVTQDLSKGTLDNYYSQSNGISTQVHKRIKDYIENNNAIVDDQALQEVISLINDYCTQPTKYNKGTC